MLKRKTIAINVTNLSDARYFAAYEVDNIAYLVAPDGGNLGQIKEIIEWVEGPNPLIQMHEYNEELMKFALESTGANGVVLPYESLREVKNFSESLWSLHHPVTALPAQNNVTPIVALTKEGIRDPSHMGRVYIMPMNIDIENFEKALQMLTESGVVLSGSEEEKVGLKSFEAQDELIDLLLEED